MEKFLILLVLASICGFVCSQTCPDAEAIKPCTCKQYPMPSTTTCANITEQDTLTNVFNKSLDSPIYQFILTDSQLQYLPASSIAAKQFHGILIQNSVLSGIFDTPPAQTDFLTDIRLIGTRLLRGVQWENFKALTNLTRIDTVETEVKKIGKEFNENVNKGLTSLKLSSCKTAVIEDGAFQGFEKLDFLEVTFAKISFLKRSMFPKPTKLWYMNFIGNQLTSLPTDIFDDMPELTMVELMDNQLTTFHEDVYGKIYRSNEIDFSFIRNPMVCDCKTRWFLPRLRFRSISGQCQAPDSMKGKYFNDLNAEDFTTC